MIHDGLAYISGAISGVEDFPLWFKVADDMVYRMGYKPVNPIQIKACPDDDCFGDESERFRGHTWSCWLRHDLIELLRCRYIFMIPGWEASHGAKLELRTALDVGIQIRFLSEIRFNYLLSIARRAQTNV